MALTALDPEMPTMAIDYISADGQSQACPAGTICKAFLSLGEFIEDGSMKLLRDANTGIGNTDSYIVIHQMNPTDDASFVSKLHGIGKKINHHLNQAVKIAQNLWKILFNLGHQDKL